MNEAQELMRHNFLETLRQLLPANILAAIREKDAWVARYPILAIQLTDYYRPRIERLRAQMELVEKGEIPDFEPSDPQQDKRDHLSLLEMIRAVEPAFPVDDLHARFCAKIDAEQQQLQEALNRQKALSEDARHVRYDVTLLTAIGQEEEAQLLQEEFRQRHVQE